MSSIVTLIESVVNDLTPKPTFVHGTKAWANLKGDISNFPMVILIEPIVSDDTFHQGGLVESSYPLFMLFLDKSELDMTPEQHRVMVDAMRDLRRQFILKMRMLKNSNGEHVFKSVANVRTTDTFNELDANSSGVGVNFTAVPLNSDSICTS